MATYKEIKGFNIKSLSTDPTNLNEGEIWYNSTSGTLKVAGVISGAWSSGTNAPRGNSGMSCVGTNTSALMWGGDTGGGAPTWPTVASEYDGSTWTSAGNIPTFVSSTGQAGTATVGLGFGGTPGSPTATIKWNGTAWSSGNVLPTGRTFYNSGAGPATAAVALCGYTAPGAFENKHDHYDGTNWTAQTVFPSPANNISLTGSQTATVGFFGYGPPTGVSITADWNGSAWTVNPAQMSSPRNYAAAGGTTSENTYIFGGNAYPGDSTEMEFYNGTTWAGAPSMSTARSNYGGAGIESNALIAGAFHPGVLTVEEFTGEYVGTTTVTTS